MRHILATEKLAALLKYFFDETECFRVRLYSPLLRQYVEHDRQIQSLIKLHLKKLANLLCVIISAPDAG